jgi:hypothetical protein
VSLNLMSLSLTGARADWRVLTPAGVQGRCQTKDASELMLRAELGPPLLYPAPLVCFALLLIATGEPLCSTRVTMARGSPSLLSASSSEDCSVFKFA